MKNINEIAFVVQARLNSERVPRKMLKPFCGSNLVEICLKKILESDLIPSDQFFFSVHEEELIDIGKNLGVNIYRRSLESITDSGITLKKLYEWHKDLPFKRYIMISACHPMLSIETIDKFVDEYIKCEYDGMFGVIEKKTYYWDHNGNMMNDWPSGKLLDTKLVKPVYEAGHCLYAGTMDQISDEIHMGTFANKHDPELFIIHNEIEALDIDYEWQFKLAELAYTEK